MSVEWRGRGIARWIRASIFLATLSWHAAAPTAARAQAPASVTARVLDALGRRTAIVAVRGTLALTPLFTLRLHAEAFVGIGRPSRPFAAGTPDLSDDDAGARVAADAPERGHPSGRPAPATPSAVVDADVQWDFQLDSSPLAVPSHVRVAEDPATAAGRGGCHRAARRAVEAGRTQLSVELNYWFAR